MNKPIVTNDKRTHRSFLLLICFVASLGGILFGFDTAVISGTFSMVESQFALDKLAVGWFGSSALVGAIAGSLVAGTLSDKYGRKPILILSALLFFISALGSVIPPSFSFLIPARLVGGFGIGMASVLAPMYISEFSPPGIRGRLVAFYQLSIVLGILLAYFSNWGLLKFSHRYGDAFCNIEWLHKIMVSEVWRGMFGAEMVPAALFFLLLLIIPESPRWLIKAGKEQRGYKILEKLNGKTKAEAELKAIRNSLLRKQGNFRELFKPGLRLALLVGLGLSVFGQFTGVNIIVYYGPEILGDAGFNFDNALKFQVAIGLINLIFTSLALWKIDSWGRRSLLIGGMSSVCISLFVIGILFSLTGIPGIWILLMLCVYMASLAFSINAVIWVLLGEIYPNRLRGKAMSVATFANWGTNFATAFIFPWFVAQIGMNAGFFVFAAFCFIAVVFFYKFVPETKGKSLEEIEDYWKG
ncbi:sugar porter family MFS transporter [Leptobacterium flavescens]|uniref:Sugar porter family MFS transporter n=1 Tax=Leptobacterium flavescens TaxID=472055 RepID=A0A6P0UMH2_9FLAO|nr:sugar porter family MFS transporter [Leptobacterium flavescens]NER13772.1 sugar porter family MFS transporter [Leptobacterium flavescens]